MHSNQTGTPQQNIAAPRAFLCAFCLVALACPLLLGCKSQPGGSPVQPAPLGSIVDETNRQQEQNAEAAKFIVYVHEFEFNKPRKEIDNPWGLTNNGLMVQDLPPSIETEPRGFRLNDYGREHIKRLAESLLQGIDHKVVVERSETSKMWDTLHHYPVHFNERLDEERRRVVVAALEALGVRPADEMVIVAPAFPTGLHSEEAVQAYHAGRMANGRSGGGGF